MSNDNALALTTYDPKSIQTFGNSIMTALVAQAGMEEEAQKLAATATEAKSFISFEMTRAVFDLSDRLDDIDPYAIFGKAKEVERLNTRVLMHMGALKRTVTSDDEIVYEWTDKNIENMYSYTKELQDEDKAEYTRRFNNRKRLNMKLSEAYKAVAALKDQGLKPADLFYSENEAGEQVPTIQNAPKELAGDSKSIQLGSRRPIVGATMSPTMSSLIKLAEKAHKVEPKTEERKDKGENRNGVAQIGMSDEDFGSICNTVIRAVNAQENVFSEQQIKTLKALTSVIAPVIAAGATKAKAAKPSTAKAA